MGAIFGPVSSSYIISMLASKIDWAYMLNGELFLKCAAVSLVESEALSREAMISSGSCVRAGM